MNHVYIRGLSMPGCIRGVTVLAPDDDFIVFVNADLCPKTQRDAAAHEVQHIRQDHFYHGAPVVIDELQANSR